MKKKIGIAIAILGICVIFLYTKNIREYPADEPEIQEDISGEEQETEETENIIEENPADYVEISPDEWEIEHVEAISLHNNFTQDDITQDDINRIGQYQHLKRLSIYIRDDELDLSPFSNLTELEAIEIDAFYANEIDVSFLADLTNLKELALYAVEIKDYSFFNSMWQLREIEMMGNTTMEDLSFFSNMPNLESLYIDSVYDADLSCLAKSKNIEEISIGAHQIRNVEALADMSQVEELSLSEYGFYGEERLTFDLHILDAMTRLESLKLMYINVEDISPLADKQSLGHITLVDTDIEDIEPLKNLNHLHWLAIYGNSSEKVQEQSELYFNDVKDVSVSWEIVNDRL